MKDETRLVSEGRDPENNFGIVNPPVYHASTVLMPTYAAVQEASKRGPGQVVYGRNGTPTTFAIQDAFSALEGADLSVSCASGKAAIVTALMAYARAGDHILMTDSAYQPARSYASGILAGYGVETTFYDPRLGAGVADLIRPNTTIVYTESPGSVTFEVQDVPAIAVVAHKAGAVVINDNTWAAGYFYRPLEHGADVVIQAGTKYIGGHSDIMLGLVGARDAVAERLWKTFLALGNTSGPDDCYLAQRGLRTLGVRLDRHHANGLRLAHWLRERPEVIRVLHPGLDDHPDHALWQRDFSGASGLFSVLIEPVTDAQLAAMLDHLELFGMGWSWGGYDCLMVPSDVRSLRAAVPWDEKGQLLRIHAGLEDSDDLIDDLSAGFARMNAAA
jgi:cystathionine beta-lyase